MSTLGRSVGAGPGRVKGRFCAFGEAKPGEAPAGDLEGELTHRSGSRGMRVTEPGRPDRPRGGRGQWRPPMDGPDDRETPREGGGLNSPGVRRPCYAECACGTDAEMPCQSAGGAPESPPSSAPQGLAVPQASVAVHTGPLPARAPIPCELRNAGTESVRESVTPTRPCSVQNVAVPSSSVPTSSWTSSPPAASAGIDSGLRCTAGSVGTPGGRSIPGRSGRRGPAGYDHSVKVRRAGEPVPAGASTGGRQQALPLIGMPSIAGHGGRLPGAYVGAEDSGRGSGIWSGSDGRRSGG